MSRPWEAEVHYGNGDVSVYRFGSHANAHDFALVITESDSQELDPRRVRVHKIEVTA